ncbi:MAG: hypothetical protein QME92_01410 [Bacillota bacterium]|nr:hypothetical protein [Bacillota bacterium]
MCCEGHAHHHSAWHAGDGCCCRAGRFPRRFLSREERLELLRGYLEDLKAEMREVERRVECLSKGED